MSRVQRVLDKDMDLLRQDFPFLKHSETISKVQEIEIATKVLLILELHDVQEQYKQY